MKPYKLRCTLYAHTGDVKGIFPTRTNGFVSVSRDLSAKIWEDNGSNEFIETNAIKSHKKYVNAVTVVYTLDNYPDGLIITGSNDQSICIYDIKSNNTIAQLSEHSGAVCTLNCANNVLYSGSFDCSMKIWKLTDLEKYNFNLRSTFTIKGHDQTVWSVLPISEYNICLTGSADKLIKQWLGDQCVKTYRGHSDCVRGLALHPTNKEIFFSCSNDGTVLQWAINDQNPARRFNITDSFLYSVCVLNQSNGNDFLFATSGEDRSLRINRASQGESPIQKITLPCQTLWNCTCLPNNDIVIACSDGTIRIFTQEENRMASKAAIEEFERELSSFSITTKTDETMSKIDRSKLPGVEALSRPGRKEGQIIMINNENEVEVYSWSQAEDRWIKIGTAVGSATAAGGSNRTKVMYEGKEYDYVFDIQLDDENTSLKLPYNLSQDPWFAAQEFIHKNELNQVFLDQIAHFIINNTQGETIVAQSSSYVDPFTGESRYVPASNTNTTGSSSSSGYLDPFTGTNAYRTGDSDKNKKNENEVIVKNEFFPQESFVLFDQQNLTQAINKIKEFQAKNKSDLQSIELMVTLIDNKTDIDKKFNVLLDSIDYWTSDTLFPILDFARVLSLDRDIQKHIVDKKLIDKYFELVVSKIDSTNQTNTMLALRVLCNLFTSYDNKLDEITDLLLLKRASIFNKLANCLQNTNKPFQICFSTLILNYSILCNKLTQGKTSDELIDSIRVELLHYISGECENASIHLWDSEALFRLLVLIGTLICDNTRLYLMAKSIVDLRQFLTKVEAMSSNNIAKVNSCLKQLKSLTIK